MAIPVARVHLAMAHAALPGLLPTPPKCTMPPLLPTPPCVVILPSSPPKPSRADAVERWDAHKNKPSGSPTSSSSSSSGSWSSMNSDKKKIAAARTSTSPSRITSSRADSEERWDAHKKPVSLSSSWSSSARSSKKKGCDSSSKRHCCSIRASSTGGRWDAHKTKPMAPGTTDDIDDGESTSTGSNDDMEYYVATATPLPERALHAGPGFIGSPDPTMLPMPTSLMMIRVA